MKIVSVPLALLLVFSARPIFSQPAPSEIALDEFLFFADPYKCELGKDFDAFITGSMFADDKDVVHLNAPVRPWKFRQQFGTTSFQIFKDGQYLSETTMQGTWMGFPVTKISLVSTIPGAGSDFTISLKAPIDSVAKALNENGFAIRPGATRSYSDNEEYSEYQLTVQLLQDPQQPETTLFGCSVG